MISYIEQCGRCNRIVYQIKLTIRAGPRALALPAGEKQLPVDLPEKVNTRESSQIAPLMLPQKQHAFSSNLCKTTNSFPFCINEDILLD